MTSAPREPQKVKRGRIPPVLPSDDNTLRVRGLLPTQRNKEGDTVEPDNEPEVDVVDYMERKQ